MVAETMYFSMLENPHGHLSGIMRVDDMEIGRFVLDSLEAVVSISNIPMDDDSLRNRAYTIEFSYESELDHAGSEQYRLDKIYLCNYNKLFKKWLVYGTTETGIISDVIRYAPEQVYLRVGLTVLNSIPAADHPTTSLCFDFTPNPVETNTDINATLQVFPNILSVSALHESEIIAGAEITLIPYGDLSISTVYENGKMFQNAKITLVVSK